jgi:hypothetical protein
MRRFAIVCIGAVAALLVAPVASAQNYPPGPTISVSDSTVPSGSETTVCGDGWMPGSVVSISIDGTDLGTAQVRPDGTFCKTVTLNVIPGDYVIRVSGTAANGQSATETVAIQVLAVVVGGGGPAFTGASISMWLVLLVAFLMLGLVLLAASHRLKSKTPSQK